MRYLILVDAAHDWMAPIERLERAARSGAAIEAVLLNVQPRFSRHIAQFTRKADRDALRAERSRAAIAQAAGRLSQAGVPYQLIAGLGDPAECLAAVAASERVDDVLVGAKRRSALERYAIPAGLAGLAALILAAE